MSDHDYWLTAEQKAKALADADDLRRRLRERAGSDAGESFLHRFDGIPTPDWKTPADLGEMSVRAMADADLRAGIANELTKHLSTMSRGWEDKTFQLGCTCGHDRGTATVADMAANLDEHLNAFRLHVADALLAGPLREQAAEVARLRAECERLDAEVRRLWAQRKPRAQDGEGTR